MLQRRWNVFTVQELVLSDIVSQQVQYEQHKVLLFTRTIAAELTIYLGSNRMDQVVAGIYSDLYTGSSSGGSEATDCRIIF